MKEKDLGASSQKLDALALKKHCAGLIKDDARVKPCKLALLREKRGLTQEKLAKRAKITQSEVSRTELREDCLVSTLERYVTALGGELVLHVKIDGQLHPVTL
jgi:DNA-binding XRE family transcriptional regulator